MNNDPKLQREKNHARSAAINMHNLMSTMTIMMIINDQRPPFRKNIELKICTPTYKQGMNEHENDKVEYHKAALMLGKLFLMSFNRSFTGFYAQNKHALSICRN